MEGHAFPSILCAARQEKKRGRKRTISTIVRYVLRGKRKEKREEKIIFPFTLVYFNHHQKKKEREKGRRKKKKKKEGEKEDCNLVLSISRKGGKKKEREKEKPILGRRGKKGRRSWLASWPPYKKGGGEKRRKQIWPVIFSRDRERGEEKREEGHGLMKFSLELGFFVKGGRKEEEEARRRTCRR